MAASRAAAAHSSKKKTNTTNNYAVIWNDGELSYISQDCSFIPQTLIRSYADVTRRLDLSFNALKSLDGLEKFAHLEELILDNNQLDDSVIFPRNPFLHTLSLNKNKITNLDDLLNKISNAFSNIRYLSLLGNEACPNQLSSLDKDDDDYQRYRYYVLYKVPKLKFLDSSPTKRSEHQEAIRIGCYMKVVRPTTELINQSDVPFELRSAYSPLPQTPSSTGSHTGAYGKCLYHYSGTHSEGNRFIRNNDL